jgi:hypothetical protein
VPVAVNGQTADRPWLYGAAGMTPQDLFRLHFFFSALSAGVSRKWASMQLAAWSDRGIPDQGRGNLVVRDRQALPHVIANG